MAFKFPKSVWYDSDWVETDKPCEICESTFNNARNLNHGYSLCRFHSMVKPEVIARIQQARWGKVITPAEFQEMWLNSYERDTLIPYIWITSYWLNRRNSPLRIADRFSTQPAFTMKPCSFTPQSLRSESHNTPVTPL